MEDAQFALVIQVVKETLLCSFLTFAWLRRGWEHIRDIKDVSKVA